MPTPPVSRSMASMMKWPSNPDTRPSPIGSLASRLPWCASTKHASRKKEKQTPIPHLGNLPDWA
eukprot:11894386-Prorocentrum_lima.AAC.1